MAVKALKAAAAAVAMTAAGTMFAPPADAMMVWGNYDLLTNRYTRASWVWYINPCVPERPPDCADVSAISRLKYYFEWDGVAWLKDGEYTMVVDTPDGLQCPGHVMPTRDTYKWNERTLVGTIESVYDVGCFNGPPGTQFWTFALQRL